MKVRWINKSYFQDFATAVVITLLVTWIINLSQADSSVSLGSKQAGQGIGISAVILVSEQSVIDRSGDVSEWKLQIENQMSDDSVTIYGVGGICNCLEYSNLPLEIGPNSTKPILLKASVDYFKSGEEISATLYCSNYGAVPITITVQ